MEAIRVKTAVFEGPMELLLGLIEKHKLNIYDIPIAELTEQYISYIELHKNEPELIENLSRFLKVAAMLLEIKTRMLLPKSPKAPEEEPDPREEITVKLIEYKHYRLLAQRLSETENTARVYYRQDTLRLSDLRAAVKTVPRSLITQEALFAAFEEVIRRREKTFKKPAVAKPLALELYTVEEKLIFLRDLMILHPRVEFFRIFPETAPKAEIIITFLALLELIRLEEINVLQEALFGSIVLERSKV